MVPVPLFQLRIQRGNRFGVTPSVGEGRVISGVSPLASFPRGALPVGTLGVVLLGGYSLRQLARAGMAEQGRDGAIDVAD